MINRQINNFVSLVLCINIFNILLSYYNGSTRGYYDQGCHC